MPQPPSPIHGLRLSFALRDAQAGKFRCQLFGGAVAAWAAGRAYGQTRPRTAEGTPSGSWPYPARRGTRAVRPGEPGLVLVSDVDVAHQRQVLGNLARRRSLWVTGPVVVQSPLCSITIL